MKIPSSTYRVQLNSQFTFRHLESIIDYLVSLGITTIYAAPILQSTPGSMHGYDVINPYKIDPEIGTLDEFRSLIRKIKERNLTWLQDIVPNHMAFHTLNCRLMDVLERGPNSPYYNYFDINWNHHSPTLKGKLQVPFLGKELKQCIDDNELTIAFSESGFTVKYFDTEYPLSIKVLELLFDGSDDLFPWRAYVKMAEEIRDYFDYKNDRDNFLAAVFNDPEKHASLNTFLSVVNNDKSKLLKIFTEQYYYLTYWKDTESEINYRRFFTVNELICLRMEDISVFNEYHTFLHQLYKEGLIQGLRIDHIDGLRDPSTYISRLRKLFGADCYIIAEKILEAKEAMPQHWQLEGTSGYEYLAFINQLVTSRKGAKQLVNFYREMVPKLPSYHELVLQNKNLILRNYMAGEWENLVEDFKALGLSSAHTDETIKEALRVFMVSMPVYRIYPSKLPLEGIESEIIRQTFDKAKEMAPGLVNALGYMESLIFVSEDSKTNIQALKFLQRLMQFTGPLTAKGVEDTTFYVYNALISHDEVGDAPEKLGISVNGFHDRMIERQHRTPLSLNATATHDTKRGEDARLRLNALCEYPEDWQTLVTSWNDKNGKFRTSEANGKPAPRINDEYYIYQSIVGGFPEDHKIKSEFIDRLIQYETKVVREAKRHSDWGSPDEEYEKACHNFTRKILQNDSDFLNSLRPFQTKIQKLAQLYSLAQVLLKCTTPGIPDIYQGCELWDLSFVDPDNRRQVDYIKRMDYLDQLLNKESEGDDAMVRFLNDHEDLGLWKMYITWKILNFRKNHPEIFIHGTYEPLQVSDTDAVMLAFQRTYQNRSIIVIVPLAIRNGEEKHHIEIETSATLTQVNSTSRYWSNIFNGKTISTDGQLSIGQALGRFPVSVLQNFDVEL